MFGICCLIDIWSDVDDRNIVHLIKMIRYDSIKSWEMRVKQYTYYLWLNNTEIKWNILKTIPSEFSIYKLFKKSSIRIISAISIYIVK
jgi:hypothetical protein